MHRALGAYLVANNGEVEHRNTKGRDVYTFRLTKGNVRLKGWLGVEKTRGDDHEGDFRVQATRDGKRMEPTSGTYWHDSEGLVAMFRELIAEELENTQEERTGFFSHH